MKRYKTVLLQTLVMVVVAALIRAQGCSTTRSRPAQAPSSGAAEQEYKAILKTWSGGDQRQAEARLDRAVAQFPSDQRLALFQAACARSRFEVKRAYPMFLHVVEMNPASVQGECAGQIAALDAGQNVNTHFVALRTLVQENPNDPIPLWLLAVQCRAHDKSGEGVRHYRTLLNMVDPGPVLIHQTYANLLDELGQHKEALAHREIAVKLEPASWSFGGLAITLDALGRHDDAERVRRKSAGLFPTQ